VSTLECYVRIAGIIVELVDILNDGSSCARHSCNVIQVLIAVVNRAEVLWDHEDVFMVGRVLPEIWHFVHVEDDRLGVGIFWRTWRS
jgi:hypothetical protein